MEEPLAKLTNILLNSLYSFLNTGLFLVEFFLALKFVDLLKWETLFKKTAAWARFVLALIVLGLATPLINSFWNKYLSALLGANPPLVKILQALEAVVLGSCLYYFYRRQGGKKG